MVLAGLVLQLHAAAFQLPRPASAISNAECLPYASFEQIIDSYSGVFLGEMHGQIQSAKLVGCLAEMVRDAGLEPVISLELSEMAEFRLGKLEYSGRVGRSVAVPELVCRVATLFEDGIADLSFHAPANGRIRPDGGFDSTFHEQGRAELIESELGAGRFVIALSGWIHVQNAHNRTGGRLDAKAGYFLPDSVALVRLTYTSESTARNCRLGGNCDVHDQQVTAHTPPFTLAPYVTDRFDYEFNVGRLTPSSSAEGYMKCPGYERTFQ